MTAIRDLSAKFFAFLLSAGLVTLTVHCGSDGSNLTPSDRPSIDLSDASRSFSATEGGADPAPQTVEVRNGGQGTLAELAASISYTAGQPTGWLIVSLSAATAPSTLTLAAITGSLTAGTYTANVAVTSSVASNSPQTLSVTFTLEPPAGGAALIALSSATQNFSGPEGGADPAPQTVEVTNGGQGTLAELAASISYPAGQPTEWLTVSLSASAAPSTLTLTTTTGSLPSGTYTASVTVTSGVALNSPQTVSVTFVVSPAAAPTITLQKSTVWAHYGLCYPTTGGNRPCGPSGYLAISNTGGGTLNWTATTSATWIRRSPGYGTAPSTMKVWVDGTGLPRGDYSGWIKVWATGATNSPQTVSVIMHRK
jgi:hypothetical protein